VSRATVIAALVAVEVAIVAVAIFAIGGLHQTGWHGDAFASMQRFDFVAKPVAPIEAGRTPHVVVDDPQSRVEVGVSTDGQVHVTDLTNVHGASWGGGEIPQLHVSRTADGVSIVRAPHARFALFGSVDERIDVTVPSAARLEIRRCSGADVSGLAADVNVRSQDGHVTLTDINGTVRADSDDGYIEATRIRGYSLSVTTADGHIALRDVAVRTLTAHTNDGRVSVVSLGDVQNGNVSTNDGSIRLELVPASNLTLNASTNDGSISSNGSSVGGGEGDGAQYTIALGNGTGTLRVSTSDGSIHIITNGVQ
jgi:hypothetical protein